MRVFHNLMILENPPSKRPRKQSSRIFENSKSTFASPSELVCSKYNTAAYANDDASENTPIYTSHHGCLRLFLQTFVLCFQ